MIVMSLISFTSKPQSHYYPSNRSQSQEEQKITINNKSYQAKELRIYVKNSSYEWEFLQTIRVPGGESVSFAIGKYEYPSNYGYLNPTSYGNSISSFGSYPLNLY